MPQRYAASVFELHGPKSPVHRLATFCSPLVATEDTDQRRVTQKFSRNEQETYNARENAWVTTASGYTSVCMDPISMFALASQH